MKRLFAFELRKLFAPHLARIALAALLGSSLLFGFATYRNMYAYDGQRREGSGKIAVEIDRDLAARYAGPLTDEKVHRILASLVPKSGPNGLNAKYIYWNAVQSAVAARFADISGNWNGASVADVFGEESITVGYVNGWLHTSRNLARSNIFLLFVLILLLAPVFSGEYGGVDAIIFTSKYGRTKCVAAKCLAALTAALLVTALTLLINLALAVLLYGTEGLDGSILFAPVTFTEGYIPFNLTCRELLRYQTLLAFTGALGVTGLTLFLSASCKSPLVSLVASAALTLVPALPIPETHPLFRLLVLMPLYHAQFLSLMSVERLQSGLLYAVWALPVGLAILAAGALLARRRFARRQVS